MTIQMTIFILVISLNVVDSQKAAFKAVGKTPSDTEKSTLERIRSDGTLGNSVKAFNLDIATGEVWLFTDLTPSMELHPPSKHASVFVCI